MIIKNSKIINRSFATIRDINDIINNTDPVFVKSKVCACVFSASDMYDPEVFIDKISKYLIEGEVYYLIAKISYGDDLSLLTNKQVAIDFRSGNLDLLSAIHSDITDQLDTLFDKYQVSDDEVQYIQVIIRKLDVKLISDISYDSDGNIDESTRKKLDKQVKLFPLNASNPRLGKEITPVIENNVATSLTLDDGENFIENVNNINTISGEKTIFNDKSRFFLREIGEARKKKYVLVDNTENGVSNKSIYSLTGNLLESITDKKINDTVIDRKIGNINYKIENNEIIRSSKVIHLSPIKITESEKKHNVMREMNPNIGVIDLETYMANDGNAKVMAGGVYAFNDRKPTTFYIDTTTKDSDKIIFDLINKLFDSKYDNYTFYCHNLGGFDSIFIIKSLLSINSNQEENPYELNILCRKDKTLKLTISKKVNNKTKRVKIVDSYAILTDSLRNLCIKFNIDILKGDFPYKFSEEKNLGYIGNTPDISFYDNIEITAYEPLVKDNWSFKEETIKYLENDLYSLYEVLKSANNSFWRIYRIQMTDCTTISRLALEIFIKLHYDKKQGAIPLINNKSLYNDLKEAYFGGITEVYKPFGNNLNYYDVNSLYPFVAKNSMPGTNCIFTDYIDPKSRPDINTLFGFFYCDIKTSNSYLGLLPVRHKGLLIFPNGSWKGWYFSEELKYASENGYKIEVLKGYEFNKENNLFDSYVDSLYDLKSNHKDISVKQTSKLLLNSFLGRFGLDINRNITELVSEDKLNYIAATRKIVSERDIDGGYTLVTYNPDIDHSICKDFNIDITKVINNKRINIKSENKNNFNFVSIAIAAAVTAYARIHINKIKKGILELGGEIYYSDTDSIVTNLDLPTSNVDPKEIGKLKLEYKVKKAYFISNKVYCLVLENNDIIIKAKGVDRHSLTVNDFINMYENNKTINSYKTSSFKDYNNGSVVLKKVEVNLDPNSYTKREKVYDSDGYWINTTPLVYPLDMKKNNLYKSSKLVIIDKSLPQSGGTTVQVKRIHTTSFTSKINNTFNLGIKQYKKHTFLNDVKIKINNTIYNITPITIILIDCFNILFLIFILVICLFFYIISFGTNDQFNINHFDEIEDCEKLLEKEKEKEKVNKLIDMDDTETNWNPIREDLYYNYYDDYNKWLKEQDVDDNDFKHLVNHIDVDYIKLLNQYSFIDNNISSGMYSLNSVDIFKSDKDIDINLLKELIKIIPSSKEEKDEELKVKELVYNFLKELDNKKNNESNLDISTPNKDISVEDMLSETSSVYEKLVLAIRSGDNITIASLSNSTVDDDEYVSARADNDENVSIKTDTDAKDIAGPYKQSNENINTVDKDTNNTRPKQLVIITKKNEDGVPAPLPVWFLESVKKPTTEEEKNLLEKEAKTKKNWASKFPFLPEHHEQIANSSPDTIRQAKILQKIDVSKDEFDDNTKYEGISRLFNETKKEKPETNLFETGEETCIEKLFDENTNKDTSKSKSITSKSLTELEKKFISELEPNCKKNVQENINKERNKD